MTKEQFINKWWPACTTTFIADLEAVIATEIAKVQEAKPELNPIAEAYELGKKIRKKHWASEDWIKKISDTESIDENCKIWITSNDFNSIKTMPDNWELYTEPIEQPQELKGNCTTFDMSLLIDQDYNPTEQPEPKYPIGGYAPGHYACICVNCKIEFMGDKRAVQCEPCAVKTTSQPAEQPDEYVATDLLEIAMSDVFNSFKKIEETKKQKEQEKIQHDAKQPAPFDKERFERMFCAVVASGEKLDFEYCKRETTYFIQQLDAYYAEKQGGNNE